MPDERILDNCKIPTPPHETQILFEGSADQNSMGWWCFRPWVAFYIRVILHLAWVCWANIWESQLFLPIGFLVYIYKDKGTESQVWRFQPHWVSRDQAMMLAQQLQRFSFESARTSSMRLIYYISIMVEGTRCLTHVGPEKG